MAVPDEAPHPGVVGASLSREVQHCYQRRSHVPPPPSASMPFARERRRSVAAMNAQENNQLVSSRQAMLWRPLRAADKEPLHCKVAEVVAVHQRKYPYYAHHPRDARRRKEQERCAKQVTSCSKLNNDSSWDKEQQPMTSVVAAQGPGSPKFKQQLHPPPLPPTPRSTHSAIIGAARVSASGAGQGTVACMPMATVPATTNDLEEPMVPVK
ncbi:uncharacterized protein LOC119443694 [Dermacentor silvarum]|uniref:uncharacterized protein LOC119443694 n=1 Tax=Dermacentor silvarum TaxID=543639 RepID=UPI00189BEE47|nr:uncharacterized protein LOC119443694 [Dermacentor silvarum]